MTKKVLKNRLRELMAEKSRRDGEKITQRGLAESLGVGKVTIDRWARNEIKQYDETLLVKLLDYFGCDFNDFFVIEELPGNDPDKLKTPLAAA